MVFVVYTTRDPIFLPMPDLLSISTDQLAALVELARQGSLRAAAETLFITEQGVRSRLLALEERLGVELYRKSRGIRRATPLTPQGQRLLPRATELLQRAEELRDAVASESRIREIHVVASQYLIAYLLIDAVRRFHAAQPTIRVRLSARTEQQIEQELLADPDVALGVAAPYESSTEILYKHLFSMPWSLITPVKHPLAKAKAESISLAAITAEPLVLYERGSTGRQHVVDAFAKAGLSPRVEMEATNTDLIVRMVAAGLGVSIVPLLANGAVTRGHRVAIRPLGNVIRPIDSGILLRRGEQLSEPCRRFVEFVQAEQLG
jgi:DNA-binding transcriptional LysR family regulator